MSDLVKAGCPPSVADVGAAVMARAGHATNCRRTSEVHGRTPVSRQPRGSWQMCELVHPGRDSDALGVGRRPVRRDGSPRCHSGCLMPLSSPRRFNAARDRSGGGCSARSLLDVGATRSSTWRMTCNAPRSSIRVNSVPSAPSVFRVDNRGARRCSPSPSPLISSGSPSHSSRSWRACWRPLRSELLVRNADQACPASACVTPLRRRALQFAPAFSARPAAHSAF
jgi:hypothetical protein